MLHTAAAPRAARNREGMRVRTRLRGGAGGGSGEAGEEIV